DLLRRSTEEHPRSARAAADYLMTAIPAAGPSARLTELTGPFAGRFSTDARIQALHAAALFKDQRFLEAGDALQRARSLDAEAVRFLGDATVRAVEEGRNLTPVVDDGLKAIKAGRYDSAAISFRRALAENPRNPLAARFLARAIAHQLASSP